MERRALYDMSLMQPSYRKHMPSTLTISLASSLSPRIWRLLVTTVMPIVHHEKQHERVEKKPCVWYGETFSQAKDVYHPCSSQVDQGQFLRVALATCNNNMQKYMNDQPIDESTHMGRKRVRERQAYENSHIASQRAQPCRVCPRD
jgi:hypothetical protein